MTRPPLGPLAAALLLACLGASGCDWLDRLLGRARPQVRVPDPPAHARPAYPAAPPPATPAPETAAPPSPPRAPAAPASSPVAPRREAASPAQPPAAARGARAVVLGDSHAAGAAYSAVLHAALEAAYPGQVAYYGVCSASGDWWLAAPASRPTRMPCYAAAAPGQRAPPVSTGAVPPLPSVEEVVAARPELLVVALGTNRDRDPRKTLEGFRDRLAAAPGGMRCVWVGPPPLPVGQDAYRAQFYRLLAEQLGGRCRVLDSRVVMAGRPPSAPGGFHYAGADARHWAQAVVNELSAR